MKHLLFLLLLFPCLLWSYNPNKTYTESLHNTFEKKSYEVSLDIQSNQNKIFGVSGIETSGYGIQVGKLFVLNKNFSTTSFLLYKSEESTKNDEIEKIVMDEIGLAQRAAFNIYVNRMILRPFVQISYSKGDMEIEEQYKLFDEYEVTDKFTIDYSRTTISTGIQSIFRERFLPYFRVDYSTLSFDDQGDVSVEIQDTSLSAQVSVNQKDKKSSSTSYIIGFGIIF